MHFSHLCYVLYDLHAVGYVNVTLYCTYLYTLPPVNLIVLHFFSNFTEDLVLCACIILRKNKTDNYMICFPFVMNRTSIRNDNRNSWWSNSPSHRNGANFRVQVSGKIFKRLVHYKFLTINNQATIFRKLNK